MAEVSEQLGGGPVYLSFDIDSLDPAFAPGTGTPEIGGLTATQGLEIIRGCRGLDLVGCDLVEVSPPYDPAGNDRAGRRQPAVRDALRPARGDQPLTAAGMPRAGGEAKKRDRFARPDQARCRSGPADHHVRPRLPVRLRRLPRSPGGPGAGAGGAARHGGGDRRGRHRRAGDGLRADEARPQARGLRGRADRRAPALAALRGRRRRDRRAGRDALPAVLDRAFYHYFDLVGLETRPFPNPLAAGTPQHGDRPRGRDDLRGAARRPAAAVPRGRRRVARGARGGRVLRRHPGGDPRRATSPRLKALWDPLVPVWDDRTLLRLRRHRPCLRQPLRSATARCSARSASAPAAGTPTSPTRCSRSCASSSPTATRTSAWWSAASSSCRGGCGGRGRADGALAARHHLVDAARRRAAPAASRIDARRRRPRSRSPTAGATRDYRGRAVDLPVLAAHRPTSTAPSPVLASRCGWRSTARATCSRPRPS